MNAQEALDRALDQTTDYPESCSHRAGGILAALPDDVVLVSRDELAAALHTAAVESYWTVEGTWVEQAGAIIAALKD